MFSSRADCGRDVTADAKGLEGALWLRQMNNITRCSMELFARWQVGELRPGRGQCEDMTPSLDYLSGKQRLKTRHSLVATGHAKILLSATGQNNFSKYIDFFLKKQRSILFCQP